MDASRHTTLGHPRATGLSREELQRKVDEFDAKQAWVHDIELPHGVRTRPGIGSGPHTNTAKWVRIEPLVDALGLAGKRVLDVGCNEGFYSLQAERRGAQVVGIDIDPARIEKARFVQETLSQERIAFDAVDIYSERFSELGPFDVCLALGFIHRLPDPLRAIARIVERADITLFEWQSFKWGPWYDTFAYYTPRPNEPGNFFNPRFWRPSPACLLAVLRDLGYDRFRLIDDARLARVVLLAGRRDHPAFAPERNDVKPRRLAQMARATRDYLAALRHAAAGH